MKRLEQVAQEGNTKIRETQAAECVIFLAELLGLPVTHALSLRIGSVPLREWLDRNHFNVGRIEKLVEQLQSNPY